MKSKKDCPICGGETIMENHTRTFGLTQVNTKVRRCENLVEKDANKPLEACLWSEEVYSNGRPVLATF